MSDAQQACAQGEPVPTGRYEIRGIVAKGNECLWAADLGARTALKESSK